MTPQGEAMDFVIKLNDIILFPLISLLMGVALLVFLYGSAKYVMNASNEQAREEGKRHIMYGLIGLVVMISAYAILNIAVTTFGLGDHLDCAGNFIDGCENVLKVQ